MAQQSWTEPHHLEAWIVAHPEVLDPSLKVVTTQFARWESDGGSARDRLDVLAVADSGELVVIELKRAGDRQVHLQALTYAALVSGFTREILANAHLDWLRLCGDSTVTLEEARRSLENHVEAEWTDELLGLPRIILVAENFPAQVITTIQWLSDVAGDITIEAHEYHLFDRGDEVAVSFQRILPVEDLEDRRLRPGLVDRTTEVKEQLSTNRRRARSVAIIAEAEAIPAGAVIGLRLESLVKPDVVEQVTSWLDENPMRKDIRWVNDPVRPLIWAAAEDSQRRWSPTSLRNEIFERAIGQPGTFSAADAWCFNGRSLYLIAQDHIDSREQ
ncbi:DNA-binding protein [Rhodococcus sp. CX]|uniref:DNA-binding protein n=1 Tax=Rhodococcus sp. CX TaxID=2789880 RepID=UPI0018CFE499|nr:DNA-binding protein [Rhodococcus sp. CX]MBH0120028.1 DNA-binding protein [Rhodococcus sp. CX]